MLKISDIKKVHFFSKVFKLVYFSLKLKIYLNFFLDFLNPNMILEHS